TPSPIVFYHTAPAALYPLSLHDALPISSIHRRDFLAASAALSGLALSGVPAFAQTPRRGGTLRVSVDQAVSKLNPLVTRVNPERSEEHTSELQSREKLVCRLLLENKNIQ